MNEWAVVGVIVTLVGLFCTVGKPIIDLITSITKLIARMDMLQDELKEQAAESAKTHERIFRLLDDHEDKLCNHETRIKCIEEKST